MIKFKYLVFTGYTVWGKTAETLTKEYFVNAIQRNDYIINIEDGTYFDKDSNSWKEIEGDE